MTLRTKTTRLTGQLSRYARARPLLCLASLIIHPSGATLEDGLKYNDDREHLSRCDHEPEQQLAW